MDPLCVMAQLLKPGEDPQLLSERLEELHGFFQLLWCPSKEIAPSTELHAPPFQKINQPPEHADPLLESEPEHADPCSEWSPYDVSLRMPQPDAAFHPSSPSEDWDPEVPYRPSIQLPSTVVDKPLAGKCPRGHELALTRIPYAGRCDGCIKQLEVTMDIMRCETCEYDLCFSCKLNGIKYPAGSFQSVGVSHIDPPYVPCSAFDALSRACPFYRPVTARRKDHSRKKKPKTRTVCGSTLSRPSYSSGSRGASSQEFERPEDKAKLEHQEKLAEVRMRAQIERKAELERELAQKAAEKAKAVQRLAEEQRGQLLTTGRKERAAANDGSPKKRQAKKESVKRVAKVGKNARKTRGVKSTESIDGPGVLEQNEPCRNRTRPVNRRVKKELESDNRMEALKSGERVKEEPRVPRVPKRSGGVSRAKKDAESRVVKKSSVKKESS